MSASTVVNPLHCVTSWSFKNTSKDDLTKKSVINMKGGNKQESPHGKVGDSVVDCLSLRYLSYRKCYSMLKAVLTHLVVFDSFSKSFNEFHHLSRIPSLIHEPSRRAFRQQFLGSPLDLYQRAEKTVDMKGGQGG